MNWISYESAAFTIAFVVSCLLLAVVEGVRPARALTQSAESRWIAHGLLFAGGAVFQAALIRASPLLVAAMVAGASWGWLNRPWLPFALRFAGAILLLDLVHYATHRLFHAFGWLWRIHEVHHSDEDYDVTTSVRFHPLEVAGGKVLYLAAIALIAPPLAAVFVAEVHTTLLNSLVHANVSFPPAVERLVRLIFITPDLHRLHHSLDVVEQNRNFGQTFVWWDWMFGTYCALPRASAEEFSTGVAGLPPGSYEGVTKLFTEPFRSRRLG